MIDAQGLRLQFPQVALRNLLRVIDMLPLFYLVGGDRGLFSRNVPAPGRPGGQHGGGARAAVGSSPTSSRSRPPDTIRCWRGRTWRRACAAVANPEAVGMAVRAVAQRDGYDPSARVELFRDLAAYFRGLVRVPRSRGLEGLTDEQFVRSVLRVIYR